MSRLSTTLLILVLSISNAADARAKQNQVAPIFPSRLGQAIDGSNANDNATAPWRNTAKQNVSKRNFGRSESSPQQSTVQAQTLPQAPRREPTLAQTYTPPREREPTQNQNDAPSSISSVRPTEAPPLSQTYSPPPTQTQSPTNQLEWAPGSTPAGSASFSLNDQSLNRIPKQPLGVVEIEAEIQARVNSQIEAHVLALNKAQAEAEATAISEAQVQDQIQAQVQARVEKRLDAHVKAMNQAREDAYGKAQLDADAMNQAQQQAMNTNPGNKNIQSIEGQLYPESSETVEFGTVMMFPANEASPADAVMIGQTEAPPMDSRPAESAMASTNQSPFKLASSSKLVARPLNPAQPEANTPPVVQPNRLAAPTTPTVTAPVNQSLVTTVVGPDQLLQDSPEEFEINVVNTSGQGVGKIVVQMVVPEDLTITQLDRKAWMDGDNRTVSWMIDELPRGHKEVIRYSVVSSTPGRHRQSISVGMNNVFQGRTDFDAVVISSENYDNIERPGFEN